MPLFPPCVNCGRPSSAGLSAFPDVGLVCPDCYAQLFPNLKPQQKAQMTEPAK